MEITKIRAIIRVDIIVMEPRIILGIYLLDGELMENIIVVDGLGNRWRLVGIRPIVEKGKRIISKYFTYINALNEKIYPNEGEILRQVFE